MASYHCTAKAGAKGKAAAHADYISREGKYSESSRYEDLESSGYGNMPKWAEHNRAHFWNAADENERANGTAYREIEIALPRELTPEQRRELVKDFIAQEIGDRHAYQWAIHKPKASLEEGEQPHAHIMYSERTRDGIERDPEQYFKRYNGKVPEKGGCKKASGGRKTKAERKAELVALRERWADVQNAHLERNGHSSRVDHRSLKDQGIDREPEKHFGGVGVRKLGQHDISAILERRAAEGDKERAEKEVSLIDLSGNLSNAKRERDLEAKRQEIRSSFTQQPERENPDVMRDRFRERLTGVKENSSQTAPQEPKEKGSLHPLQKPGETLEAAAYRVQAEYQEKAAQEWRTRAAKPYQGKAEEYREQVEELGAKEPQNSIFNIGYTNKHAAWKAEVESIESKARLYERDVEEILSGKRDYEEKSIGLTARLNFEVDHPELKQVIDREQERKAQEVRERFKNKIQNDKQNDRGRGH